MYERIVITEQAKKDLSKLDKITNERILRGLLKLKTNQQVDLRKLRGTEDEWRLRVGDYRVRLKISREEIIIYALSVKHRRDAYR
jgi:mRNA interferase RelE/StbE